MSTATRSIKARRREEGARARAPRAVQLCAALLTTTDIAVPEALLPLDTAAKRHRFLLFCQRHYPAQFRAINHT